MTLPISNQSDLNKATRIYLFGSKSCKLMNAYAMWVKLGLALNFKQLGSTFFIIREIKGYKTVKFYLDSHEYRVSGYCETLSDAYNQGVSVL